MPNTQSLDELRAHLEDHLGFLRSSSEAFDNGQTGEAKRLAVSLRVLFHDTAQSHSLLIQVDRLGGKFISTAIPHDPRNAATHGGLIMTTMSTSHAAYVAPLDDTILERWLSFPEWWSEIVFVDDLRATVTRKALVLAVANQDGGAHVDPTLSDVYARLSRHNSLGWVLTSAGASSAIESPERAAIRQIAHETLKTLIPGYRKQPKLEGEIVFGGAMLVEGDKAPPLPRPERIGRNDRCPCGSGRKFKRCHGAI